MLRKIVELTMDHWSSQSNDRFSTSRMNKHPSTNKLPIARMLRGRSLLCSTISGRKNKDLTPTMFLLLNYANKFKLNGKNLNNLHSNTSLRVNSWQYKYRNWRKDCPSSTHRQGTCWFPTARSVKRWIATRSYSGSILTWNRNTPILAVPTRSFRKTRILLPCRSATISDRFSPPLKTISTGRKLNWSNNSNRFKSSPKIGKCHLWTRNNKATKSILCLLTTRTSWNKPMEMLLRISRR